MSSPTDGPGRRRAQALRYALTVALGVCAGLAVVSGFAYRPEMIPAALELRIPPPERFTMPLALLGILRAAVEPGPLERLTRIRRACLRGPAGLLGMILYLLVFLNLLFMLDALWWHGTPQWTRALGRLARFPDGWEGATKPARRLIGPKRIFEECLEVVPPDGKILIAADEWPDRRPYFLAYYLYPRAIFVHPSDQERLFFSNCDLETRPADPGWIRHPVDGPPEEHYRDFIRSEGIGWVILIRSPHDPDDCVLLPAGEVFR